MVERMGINALARTKEGNGGEDSHPSQVTVLKLLADAGDTAIDFLDAKMRDLPVRYVQADEMFAFVGIRGRTLFANRMRAPEGKGVFWIWVAIDPVSKLIPWWHVGGRGSEDARIFIQGLKDRCQGRIQLTTDSHSAYYEAVNSIFGADIDYATVKKQDDVEQGLVVEEYTGVPYKRTKRPKREMQPPVVRVGDPDMDRVTTNHIETFFQKLRQNLGRFTRRSALHSKTLQNLKRALALYIFHYNFGRIHSTIKTTPAIAAGVEDTIWTWADFLDLVDADAASKKAARLAQRQNECQPKPETERVITLGAPRLSDPLAYTVMYSVAQKYTKVHLTSCKHLRDTPERQSKKGNTHKFQCETFEQAQKLAFDFVPDEVAVCKVCLGNYHRLDLGRGKGGKNTKH
jgi:IS1 family transposase